MKFTTNTKPLAEALNLGIIDSNVSNFYRRSNVLQLTATADTLKINIESSMICTEISVKGVGEGELATAFVNCVRFKKLIHTLESNVTIEFAENGIKLQSGNSKFALGDDFGDAISASDSSLRSPVSIPDGIEFSDIHKEDWKFVKDNQMYAISKDFSSKPIYTKVWVGEDGGVLTGNFDLGLFTYSKLNQFGATCLLSDTIVNLLNSLPDYAQIAKVGTDYVVKFSKDSYDYVTQFTPQYEDDSEIGDYRSSMIIEKMTHPEITNKVFTGLVTKLLNQADLLSMTNNDYITLSIKEDDYLHLEDDNVHGKIPLEEDNSATYSVKFKLSSLKQVISNYGDRYINISPIFSGDITTGIVVWNEELTTICAGVQ